MNVSEFKESDTVVLLLSGQAGGIEFIQFCRMVEAYKEQECARIIVDLRKVTFIDSCAIGGFIYLSKIMKKSGTVFVLRAPSGQLRDLFRQCSLEGILEIENKSVDNAINASTKGRSV